MSGANFGKLLREFNGTVNRGNEVEVIKSFKFVEITLKILSYEIVIAF